MATMTVTTTAKDDTGNDKRVVHLVPVGLGLCDGASEQLLQQRQVVHLVSGSQRTRPAHRRGHVLRAGPALLAHHLRRRSIGKLRVMNKSGKQMVIDETVCMLACVHVCQIDEIRRQKKMRKQNKA